MNLSKSGIKISVLILFSYFLILFQNSFLIHFNIFGVFPNLILILVCLLSFFSAQGLARGEYASGVGPASGGENPHQYFGLIPVIAAGFFLDIFSDSFFGISAIFLIVIYFFIKKSIHLLRDISKKYSIVYFIPLFIISLLLYNLLFGLFFYFLNYFVFSLSAFLVFLMEIIYNLPFAIIGFYLFKKVLFLRSSSL